MAGHFDTAPNWPQTRAEVDAAPGDLLRDFIGECDVEPADFDACLACYAYLVVQRREATAEADEPAAEVLAEASLRASMRDRPRLYASERARRLDDASATLAALPAGWRLTNEPTTEQTRDDLREALIAELYALGASGETPVRIEEAVAAVESRWSIETRHDAFRDQPEQADDAVQRHDPNDHDCRGGVSGDGYQL